MASDRTQGAVDLIPASTCSLEELTDAYNRARVSFVVPLPMTEGAMGEYVHTYDIDLDASALAVNGSELGYLVLFRRIEMELKLDNRGSG